MKPFLITSTTITFLLLSSHNAHCLLPSVPLILQNNLTPLPDRITEQVDTKSNHNPQKFRLCRYFNVNYCESKLYKKHNPIFFIFCRSQNETLSEPHKIPLCSLPPRDLLRLGLSRPGNIVRFQNESILPSWTNIDLVVRGQQFAMDNIFTISLSYLFGLTLLLSIPPVADDLLLTGNSDDPQKAANRYAATVVQVILWMRRALNDSQNGKRNQQNPRLLEQSEDNWVLESLRNVRFIHITAANKIKGKKSPKTLQNKDHHPINSQFWEAVQRDLDSSHIPHNLRSMPETLQTITNSSVPMNQFSFSMTLFAFIGFSIIRSKELYARERLFDESEQDVLAFVHMFAVYGHALGIEDEFNIALQPNLQILTEYLEEIFQSYFISSLFNLSYGSKVLLEAFLQAAPQVFTGTDPETIFRQCLKQLLHIPTPNLDKRRNPIGLKYDALLELGRGPAALLPVWVPLTSPLIGLYHFKVGLQFFGDLYSSDENIAKQCFYYK